MRLTIEIRTEVIETVLKKKINPKVEAAKNQLITITQQAADNRYPKKIRDWLAAAPKGGVSTRATFKLKIGDELIKHPLLNNGSHRPFSISIKRAVPVTFEDAHDYALNLTPAQAKKARAVLEKLDRIQAEKAELIKTLKGALYACSTRKQLETTYPELAKYLPKPKQQTQSLVVTREQVTAALEN